MPRDDMSEQRKSLSDASWARLYGGRSGSGGGHGAGVAAGKYGAGEAPASRPASRLASSQGGCVWCVIGSAACSATGCEGGKGMGEVRHACRSTAPGQVMAAPRITLSAPP
jgi:hypothetical protein